MKRFGTTQSTYQSYNMKISNLKYWIPDHISIVFHKLSGHDAYLLIKELRKYFSKGDIGVIAEKKEKYIGFNVKINVKLTRVTSEDVKEVRKNIQLRFIHSCRFMASSLDILDSDLDDDQCKTLDFYKGNEDFKLLRRSGVYPYMYMNS